MTTVSIVIPCYNHADYVGEAVESALCQDYPDVEVIVVDDGSTDNSWGVISLFGEKINPIRLQNGGVSQARNHGIRHSNGEFIKFLDSDDLLYPGVIRRQLKEISTLDDNSMPVGTLHSFRVTGRVRDVWPTAPRPLHGSPIPLETLFLQSIQVSCPLFRKAALEKIGGFREDIVFGEDFDLNFRMYLAEYKYVMFYTRNCLMRDHDRSRLSKPSNGEEVYLKLVPWFEEYLSAFENHQKGGLSASERVAFSRLVWSRARLAARLRYDQAARQLFALAWRIGGYKAQYASRPLRALNCIIDPVKSERIARILKRILRYS